MPAEAAAAEAAAARSTSSLTLQISSDPKRDQHGAFTLSWEPQAHAQVLHMSPDPLAVLQGS